jgi:hypothetical protein
MTTPTIVVGIATAGQTERVRVTADRTDWTRDDTLVLYDDGTQVAEFPNAEYAIHADNLED